MKISGINPVFVTDDMERDIANYQSLGYKKLHRLHENNDIDICVMETDSGSILDILKQPGTEPGSLGIRINVDDLEGAVAFYEKIGFKTTSEVFSTKTNRIILMEAPHNDATYIIVHHLKK